MPENVSAAPRIWSLPFVLTMLIAFGATAVIDVLQAALPVLIQQSGGTSSLSGVVVSIFSLSAIPPALVAGVLADYYGCRKVMICGAVIFLIGMTGPLFISSLWLLLIFRVLEGIGYAVVNVTSAAGAANVLPKARLGEGIGYFGVGQAIAMALGPTAGLALAVYGEFPVWLSVAIASAILLVLALLCKCNRSAEVGEPLRRPEFQWRNVVEKRAVLPAAMIWIFCTGTCAIIVYAGLYAKETGFGNAGLFFVIAAAAMLASRVATGKIIEKYSTLPVLLPTMAVALPAFLMPGLFPSHISFYVCSVCFGASFGITMPLLAALAVKRTPKERWGAANATYYLCISLGFGTGALLGGIAIDHLGFDRALCLGALAAVIPAVLGILFLRQPDAER